MAQSSDRNLLLAVLAVQNEFITRDQLIDGMNAWIKAKHRPLGELLHERGALDDMALGLLDALVDRRLARDGGDAEASLRSLMVGTTTLEVLASMADPDVRTACS